MPQTVVIAGATGYLGRYLVAEYMLRGWNVIAVVRPGREAAAPKAAKVVAAEVTQPATLTGVTEGAHLVISAVGITRQRDGLTYQQVDYQANQNLLDEAIRSKVPHFAYIHVLKGETMAHLPAIRAKQEFVKALQQASANGSIQKSTVISPCGFFSDMRDFLDMAKQGRVYLFGKGQHKINPIHGQDLAQATADAIDQGRETLNVGGPDVFTHQELAELALVTRQLPPTKITHIWDGLRTLSISVLPWITPLSVYGPAQFFLTAMGQDMVGDCHGDHHLKDYFSQVVKQEEEQALRKIEATENSPTCC